MRRLWDSGKEREEEETDLFDKSVDALLGL
jgi:hypothetical protein